MAASATNAHAFEGEGPLGALHRWMYPPESKFFWYRKGKVNGRPLTLKYAKLALLSLLAASAGSGTLMLVCATFLTALMQEFDALRRGMPGPWSSAMGIDLLGLGVLAPAPAASELLSNATATADLALQQQEIPDYFARACADPFFVLPWMLAAGASTTIIYFLSASAIHNEYYVKRRDKASEWKCQPTKFPTPELLRQEQQLGLFNSFLAGFLGLGLFFLHQNRPFLKLYFTVDAKGWAHFAAGCVLVFLWVEMYSYFMHRLLHTPWLYKNVHKVHHTWKYPTAFGGFALHPVEFVLFQTAGIWCAVIFPVHLMSFLTVVTFTAFHNQIDHSGIDFEGDLPWSASTAFHDDHHRLFHVNFGVTLVLFDWLGGTIRAADRVYGEDRFVGGQQQDAKKVK